MFLKHKVSSLIFYAIFIEFSHFFDLYAFVMTDNGMYTSWNVQSNVSLMFQTVSSPIGESLNIFLHFFTLFSHF